MLLTFHPVLVPKLEIKPGQARSRHRNHMATSTALTMVDKSGTASQLKVGLCNDPFTSDDHKEFRLSHYY